MKLPALPRGASVVKPSPAAPKPTRLRSTHAAQAPALRELRRGRLSPFLPVLPHGASWRRRVTNDRHYEMRNVL
jgi:hypothetical protein